MGELRKLMRARSGSLYVTVHNTEIFTEENGNAQQDEESNKKSEKKIVKNEKEVVENKKQEEKQSVDKYPKQSDDKYPKNRLKKKKKKFHHRLNLNADQHADVKAPWKFNVHGKDSNLAINIFEKNMAKQSTGVIPLKNLIKFAGKTTKQWIDLSEKDLEKDSNSGRILISCHYIPHMVDDLDQDHIKTYRSIFDEIDTDGSGSISKVELGKMFTKLGKKVHDDQVKKMIMCVDNDHDGEVDFDEFLVLMTRVCHQNKDGLKEVFDKFDLNGDGFIDKQELITVMGELGEEITDKVAQHMIEENDKNNDGKLDFSEFLVMMT